MTRIALTLAFVLALSTGALGTFDAASWVRAHRSKDGQPDMDDLKELQTENPEAYAIVKALLVKQSLGLIKKKDTDEDNAGSEFQDTSTKSSHRSFWGWKPPDDSAEVSGVLSQVAGLSAMKSKSSKTLAPDDTEEAAPAQSAAPAEPEVATEEKTEPAPAVEPATPKATSSGGGKDGSFWSGLFSSGAKESDSKPKEEAVAPKPVEETPKKSLAAIGTTSNSLTNFDWNSDDSDDSDNKAAAKPVGLMPAGNSYAHFLA